MSDDDDLFGASGSDSDDTADLLASSKTPAAAKGRLKKKGAAPAKKAAAAPKKKAAAKKKAGSDDDSDNGGLFGDSDSDDDDGGGGKKKKAAPKKQMSKKERMEALAKRHRPSEPEKKPESKSKKGGREGGAKREGGGYDSDDSVDSAEIQRTEEDDAFIDTTGEDADAVNELYAAQHFDDEEADEDGYGSKKKKSKKRNYDREDLDGRGGAAGNTVPDNPIMAAVHRMKRKKKEKRSFTDMEDEIKMFLGKMEAAADTDETSLEKKQPAVQKLSMLNEVVEMMTRKDMQRMLLDLDILQICKRWIQPLQNGTLPNVTVRQRLLHAIAGMVGENGINANDLKRSELGKVVMLLYKHKNETPAMKQLHKQLIEQWSRPIFQKSGNMKDLERVHASRGAQGLAGLSRQQAQLQHLTQRNEQQQQRAIASRKGGQDEDDLHHLIASGNRKASDLAASANRVRVPYSKGFAFSVRPVGKSSLAQQNVMVDKRRIAPGAGGASADNRGKLAKRMMEKGRTASKNQRSANVSIEGRATK